MSPEKVRKNTEENAQSRPLTPHKCTQSEGVRILSRFLDIARTAPLPSCEKWETLCLESGKVQASLDCLASRVHGGWSGLDHTNSSLAGVVEVEEGEVNGQELCVSSHSISRISFAKEPHVQQVSPTSSHPSSFST